MVTYALQPTPAEGVLELASSATPEDATRLLRWLYEPANAVSCQRFTNPQQRTDACTWHADGYYDVTVGFAILLRKGRHGTEFLTEDGSAWASAPGCLYWVPVGTWHRAPNVQEFRELYRYTVTPIIPYDTEAAYILPRWLKDEPERNRT